MGGGTEYKNMYFIFFRETDRKSINPDVLFLCRAECRVQAREARDWPQLFSLERAYIMGAMLDSFRGTRLKGARQVTGL